MINTNSVVCYYMLVKGEPLVNIILSTIIYKYIFRSCCGPTGYMWLNRSGVRTSYQVKGSGTYYILCLYFPSWA